jgi:ribonucleotide reductase alpha subunit
MSKSSAAIIIDRANRLHFPVAHGGRARNAWNTTPLIPEDELAEFVELMEMSVPSKQEIEQLNQEAKEQGKSGSIEIEDWIGTQASIRGADGDIRFYKLAGRIIADQMWSEAPATFVEAIELMKTHENPKTGAAPLIGDRLYITVRGHPEEDFESWFVDPHEYADRMHFIGMCTLRKNYPLRTWEGRMLENPNYIYLRVVLAINGFTDDAREHFKLLSSGRVSQASPTMFNAGTPIEQDNSCFLMQIKEDSIEGIYEALKYVAVISRDAGGVGLTVSNIRAAGSPIRGLHPSDGLVPMLRNFNETAHYVDQGKTKRPGAFAVYLDVWHGDLEDFCMLRLKSGDSSRRTPKLHIAIWSNDVFMQRVRDKGKWSLMCPQQCPGLTECHGKEFENLYTKYEREGKYIRQVDAEDVKKWIAGAMCMTGEPYFLQKDHACHGSNQQHLGTLKMSNLCVDGSTIITTSKGPFPIGNLVPGSKQRKQMALAHENMAKQVESAEKRVEEAGEFATSVEKARTEQLREHFARMQTKEDLDKYQEIEVWDGKEWVMTTPRLISEETPLMTIVTDFGTKLMVSRQHQFVLGDGVTKVAAEDLRLGQELTATAPVEYSGTDTAETSRLQPQGAYLTGFITAYALKTYGKELKYNPGKAYTITTVRFSKKDIKGTRMEKMLDYVEYNQAEAEKEFPDIDHDELAVVSVPESMRTISTPTLAVSEERKAWVMGFVDMLGGALNSARGPLDRMQGVVRMFRSVKEDVRLRVDPTDNSWSLCARNGELPKVMTMIDSLYTAPSYCFDTPSHMAVFDEQLTGQCTEILQFVSPDEIACCTLCSFALPMYWDKKAKEFMWDKFETDVIHQVKYMNRVIDTTYYALEEMSKSNLTHRPLAMGVQGLATLFALADMPWEERDGAKIVPNKRTRVFHSRVFECMYRAALLGSIEVAKERGSPYKSFPGSPLSKGLFRFDLFPKHDDDVPLFYTDWDIIRDLIAIHGTANSLLLGPMPTATTAKILNNSEGIDPILTNTMVQSGLAGNFLWTNPEMVHDCKARGLWSDELRDAIEVNQGSVQGLLPEDLAWKYKTHWELSKKVLIRFQADRQSKLCQGQSFNTRFFSPDIEMVWRALDYSWELGNPNGVYYTRSNSAMAPQNMTASLSVLDGKKSEPATVCYLEEGGCCDS